MFHLICVSDHCGGLDCFEATEAGAVPVATTERSAPFVVSSVGMSDPKAYPTATEANTLPVLTQTGDTTGLLAIDA